MRFLIGSRQRLNTLPRPLHLTIGGVPVNQVSVSAAKSLGIYIDENLSWGSHIEKLIKKVASGVGALRRIRSFVPFETLKLIFNVLVRPRFDYCSVMWANYNLTRSYKLQRLQNRAARILNFSSYDSDVEDLISRLGWRKLSSRRDMQKANMVIKSLNVLAPEYQ